MSELIELVLYRAHRHGLRSSHECHEICVCSHHAVDTAVAAGLYADWVGFESGSCVVQLLHPVDRRVQLLQVPNAFCDRRGAAKKGVPAAAVAHVVRHTGASLWTAGRESQRASCAKASSGAADAQTYP
eukprot:SAG31_NODE_1047_length_10174_cov_3.130819_5_plen_129_part_00